MVKYGTGGEEGEEVPILMLEWLHELAGLFRERRLRLGLTQREVAARADIPVSLVSRMESGLANPTAKSLAAFARALNARPVLALEPIGRKKPRERSPAEELDEVMDALLAHRRVYTVLPYQEAGPDQPWHIFLGPWGHPFGEEDFKELFDLARTKTDRDFLFRYLVYPPGSSPVMAAWPPRDGEPDPGEA